MVVSREKGFWVALACSSEEAAASVLDVFISQHVHRFVNIVGAAELSCIV